MFTEDFKMKKERIPNKLERIEALEVFYITQCSILTLADSKTSSLLLSLLMIPLFLANGEMENT